MDPTAVEPGPTHRRVAATPAGVTGGEGGGVGGDGAQEVVIDVSSSDTDSDDPGGGGGKRPRLAAGRGRGGDREEKKARILAAASAVPAGFLEPLPQGMLLPAPPPERTVTKQFWKAGDYDGNPHLLAVEAAQHSGNNRPFFLPLISSQRYLHSRGAAEQGGGEKLNVVGALLLHCMPISFPEK
jgi:hypothetical protein